MTCGEQIPLQHTLKLSYQDSEPYFRMIFSDYDDSNLIRTNNLSLFVAENADRSLKLGFRLNQVVDTNFFVLIKKNDKAYLSIKRFLQHFISLDKVRISIEDEANTFRTVRYIPITDKEKHSIVNFLENRASISQIAYVFPTGVLIPYLSQTFSFICKVPTELFKVLLTKKESSISFTMIVDSHQLSICLAYKTMKFASFYLKKIDVDDSIRHDFETLCEMSHFDLFITNGDKAWTFQKQLTMEQKIEIQNFLNTAS